MGAATLIFDHVQPVDGRGTYRLTVPGLSLDTGAMTLSGGGAEGPTGVAFLNFRNLDFTVFGYWAFHYNAATNSKTYDNYLNFAVTGYQTPAAAMPTAGSAAYSGPGNVTGTLLAPLQDGTVLAVDLGGDAAVNANFATGAVTGQLTNMKASSWMFSNVPMNDIALNGSISGATMSGSTTAGNPPLLPPNVPSPSGYPFPAGATGTFNGAFYGPQAQEVGAVWTISGGGKAAVGVLAAGH